MQVSSPPPLILPGAPIAEATGSRTNFKSFLTEQLQVVLERRSVRFGVIGIMMVGSSMLALISTPLELDYGWAFIVPVAISAVAAGLSEGLLVAFIASLLCALYVVLGDGSSPALIAGVVCARFALYGITAAFLGAFAETHHSVQMSLRELASTDPLTRVANIATFYEDISALVRERAPFGVLVVDVDDLKFLNDTHGHQVGSAAIQLVANALRRVVRGSDRVARFGGDEFAVLLRDADLAGCRIVVNRVREMLAEESLYGAPDASVKISAGAAIYGLDGVTAEELVAKADVAMYRDKRAHKSGRNQLVLP
jgi:diguanylate cyclase (GGDEF)-like protein